MKREENKNDFHIFNIVYSLLHIQRKFIYIDCDVTG